MHAGLVGVEKGTHLAETHVPQNEALYRGSNTEVAQENVFVSRPECSWNVHGVGATAERQRSCWRWDPKGWPKKGTFHAQRAQ
jgi:hypothetical protein